LSIHGIFYQQLTALTHISKKIPGSRFSFRVFTIQPLGLHGRGYLMILKTVMNSPKNQIKAKEMVIRSRQEKIFAVPPKGFPAG
jgi:hypothetical protein